MLCGFDEDLAGQINQTSNRIRGLLTQVHPALERVVGPHLDHPAMLDLLEGYPSPTQLGSLTQKQLANRLLKLAPRMGKNWAAEILRSLSEQTVVVLGTQAASIVLPRLARQLTALRAQREEVAKEVERLVLAHPLHPVLTSMPGVGVRTAARLLIDVVSRAFASAAHLAAYAGLAPVTRRSGSSIRGELPSRRGNKQLKRALFLSAFAALRYPISRAYYARARSAKRSAITKHLSPLHVAAATCCLPCCATEPFIARRGPNPVGKKQDLRGRNVGRSARIGSGPAAD